MSAARVNKSLVVAIAGLVVAGLTAGVAIAGNRSPARKSTVVMVHDADSSGWDGVIRDLERDGYPVIVSASPLRGSRADAE